MKDCLVIIPSYNESLTIVDVVEKIKKVDNVDYLVIDDFSFDTTDIICKKNNINFIKNESNLGLSKSMRVGMKYALKNNYKYCIQFDGDGQHDALTIRKMIDIVENQDIDIVLTYRKNKKDSDNYFLKKIIWDTLCFLFKIKTKILIKDMTCGLRLYDQKFMEKYVENKKMQVEPSTILLCVKKYKMKITQIETVLFNRKCGESTFDNKIRRLKYVFTQIWKMFWI